MVLIILRFFSPVAKMVIVRFLIVVAFLHGFIGEDIYMTVPLGYKDAKKG